MDVVILGAVRRHLVDRGYSRLSIAEVAAEAGVSRPTVYRRWRTKFELVSGALDDGLRAQERRYAQAGDPMLLAPREALAEAIRRVDPCWANPDAVVLQGNLIGETHRAPTLLAVMAQNAVEPRIRRFEDVLVRLRTSGHVRADVDVHTLGSMCFGAFFGAHLRGERDHAGLAERIASSTWALIATSAAVDQQPRRATLGDATA